MVNNSMYGKLEILSNYSQIPAFVFQDPTQILYSTYEERDPGKISILSHLTNIEFSDKLPKLIVYNGLEIYGLFRYQEKNEAYNIVVGPILTTKPMAEINIQLLSFTQLYDLDTVKRFMKVVPLMTIPKFAQYLLIVFSLLSGLESSFEDVIQNKIVIETKPLFGSRFKPHSETLIDNALDHHPEHEEITAIEEAVKSGNIDAVKDIVDKSYFLRNYMNHDVTENFTRFVAATSLIAKATFDAGILFEDTLSIASSFIKYAEDIESKTDFLILIKTMILAFATRIYEENNRLQYPSPVKKAISYIETHLHYPISLQNIAKHVDLSRAYFSQLFANKTGIPLQKYVKMLKVQEAEQMLKYSHQSIGEISEALAFCSQSYFTEVFKEINHMTPVAYRNKYRKMT